MNEEKHLKMQKIIAQEEAGQMTDLRELAELYNLKIDRESKVNGTPVIVVKNEKGEDVNIGFPFGRKLPDGGAAKPNATGKIANIPFRPLGDGIWMYYLDI